MTLTEEKIDELRMTAFRTNDPADRQAYFDAVSEWFQHRDTRSLRAARSASIADTANLEDIKQDFYKQGFNAGREIGRNEASIADTAGAKAVSVGDWLWSELMDYCKARGIAPATADRLFEIVKRARAMIDAAPPAPSVADAPIPYHSFEKCAEEVWQELARKSLYYLEGNLPDGPTDQREFEKHKALLKARAERSSVADAAGASESEEPLVRYCPGCGSIGAVGAQYRDCCPDGSDARMVPQKFAQQCRDTFKLAIAAIAKESGND